MLFAGFTKGDILPLFGVAVIIQIADKIMNGVPPSSTLMLMLIFGRITLAANLGSLGLLWRFRRENVNMSSTFERFHNNAASNVGVLTAARLVASTGTAWRWDMLRSPPPRCTTIGAHATAS